MSKCDSTHEGNGRPGAGIMFHAAEKLLRAVSELIDSCEEGGAASSRALAAVKRRENQLIDASARHDAVVSSLRKRIADANAKIAEMARLAEDSAKAAEELTACDEPCAWRHIINTNPFSKEPEEYFYPSCCHGAYQIDHGFIYCPQCGRKIKESDDDDA